MNLTINVTLPPDTPADTVLQLLERLTQQPALALTITAPDADAPVAPAAPAAPRGPGRPRKNPAPPPAPAPQAPLPSLVTPAPAPAPAPAAPAAPAISLDQLRSLLTVAMHAAGQATGAMACKQVFSKFGVPNLSSLPVDQYPAMAAALQQAAIDVRAEAAHPRR